MGTSFNYRGYEVVQVAQNTWRICLDCRAIRYGPEFPVDRTTAEEARLFINWMVQDHADTVNRLAAEGKR